MSTNGILNIRRIVVTGDLLRPGPRLQLGWQNRYIRTFHAALAPIIRSAVKIPVEYILAEPSIFDQLGFYNTMGRSFTLENWLYLFADTAVLDPALEDRLVEPFVNSFIIGFELPELMRRLFRARGIPFLDLAFGPLQFLDDATIIMRSDDKALMDRLCDFNLPTETLNAAAGLMTATALCAPLIEPRPDGPAVLFCASTATDRNLYGDGRFVTYLDVEDQVRTLASEYKTVYFKPHPYGFCTGEEVALFRTLTNVRFTTANIYWMMAALDGLEAVVSMCSSASLEARYFGKRGINLVRPPAVLLEGNQRRPRYDQAWVSVMGELWSGHFWRRILEPFVPVTRGRTVELPPKANRLRSIFWSFGPAALIDLLPQHHAFDRHLETLSRTVDQYYPETNRLSTARSSVQHSFDNGEYSAVVDLLESGDPTFRKDPVLLYYMALARSRLGAPPKEALELMDEAIARGHDRFWGHYQRAFLRRNVGDNAGALEDMREAERLNPSHPGVQRALAGLNTGMRR